MYNPFSFVRIYSFYVLYYFKVDNDTQYNNYCYFLNIYCDYLRVVTDKSFLCGTDSGSVITFWDSPASNCSFFVLVRLREN